MMNAFLILFVTVLLIFGDGWQDRGRSKQGELPRAKSSAIPPEEAPEPDDVYKGLRNRILTLKPEELGVEESATSSKAYGMLMEIGLSKGLVSVTSFNTGDASLYWGTGGGILGGGSFDGVKRAARASVAEAEKHLPQMALTKEFPYAGVDHIRFYVLTRDGVYTADASEDQLVGGRHALSPLFRAGNDVITQLRLNTEKKE